MPSPASPAKALGARRFTAQQAIGADNHDFSGEPETRKARDAGAERGGRNGQDHDAGIDLLVIDRHGHEAFRRAGRPIVREVDKGGLAVGQILGSGKSQPEARRGASRVGQHIGDEIGILGDRIDDVAGSTDHQHIRIAAFHLQGPEAGMIALVHRIISRAHGPHTVHRGAIVRIRIVGHIGGLELDCGPLLEAHAQFVERARQVLHRRDRVGPLHEQAQVHFRAGIIVADQRTGRSEGGLHRLVALLLHRSQADEIAGNAHAGADHQGRTHQGQGQFLGDLQLRNEFHEIWSPLRQLLPPAFPPDRPVQTQAAAARRGALNMQTIQEMALITSSGEMPMDHFLGKCLEEQHYSAQNKPQKQALLSDHIKRD